VICCGRAVAIALTRQATKGFAVPQPIVRIGVVGTGHIAQHFLRALADHEGFEPSRVLTRRPLEDVRGLENLAPTHSIGELVEMSDVILECSGDAVHATDVAEAAVAAGIPIVTMDAEFQVTTASAFIGRGIITEAEGDQPGSLAALAEDAREMGFRPLVYGNMKGFLNLDPQPEEMRYWAERQGYSVAMTTAFTDGTKVNVEQVLVANGLRAAIIQPGLLGPADDDLREGGMVLARHAEALGTPVSDYVLSARNSHGVFLVATHDPSHAAALENYKLGPGPHYLLMKPDLVAYLEIMKTVKRVVRGQELLLDNSAEPAWSVATIAKRAVPAGTRVESAFGSFDFRGIAVGIRESAGHVPIGLMRDVVVRRRLEPGEMVMCADLEIPESAATRAWSQIEQRALGAPAAPRELSGWPA